MLILIVIATDIMMKIVKFIHRERENNHQFQYRENIETVRNVP